MRRGVWQHLHDGGRHLFPCKPVEVPRFRNNNINVCKLTSPQPGTYKICSPVIQLYYSQFIGDPHDPPVIKGCKSFKGIALFDSDPYIPGGYVLVRAHFCHLY